MKKRLIGIDIDLCSDGTVLGATEKIEPLSLIRVRDAIAYNLNKIMKWQEIDIENLAQDTGIKVKHLKEILNGRRCNLFHLVRLSNVLNIDIEDFFR